MKRMLDSFDRRAMLTLRMMKVALNQDGLQYDRSIRKYFLDASYDRYVLIFSETNLHLNTFFGSIFFYFGRNLNFPLVFMEFYIFSFG